MVSVNEFPIATANEIPGFKIIETKGFVYGLTVRSRGVGGQVSAGLRSLVGGEIKEYVSRFCRIFGYDENEIWNSPFTKIVPDSKNPYKQMYVAN